MGMMWMLVPLLAGCGSEAPAPPAAPEPAVHGGAHPDLQRYTGSEGFEVGAPLGRVDGAPKNVILMIGDGMGPAQIVGAHTANGGRLHMQRMPVTGLSITSSASDWITDSAAGATAMACGVKTTNGYVGVDPAGKAVKTLAEEAEAAGMRTGLLATSEITHATPASFFAHHDDRNAQSVLSTFMPESGVDLFMGGGKKFFAQASDGRDVLQELQAKGYTLLDGLEGAKEAKLPVGVFIGEDDPATVLDGRGPVLMESVAWATQALDGDAGFFLLVEGSQIDWGGHDKDLAYAVSEAVDFDRAIGEALRFAEADGQTLVIVTADHETGGLSLHEGDPGKREVAGVYTRDDHTPVWVPVFAYGPGAERFTGVFENTAIHARIRQLKGWVE